MSKILLESPLAFRVLKRNFTVPFQGNTLPYQQRKRKGREGERKKPDPECPNRHVQPLLTSV